VFLEDELRSFQAQYTPEGTKVRFTLKEDVEIGYSLILIGTVQAENAALVHLAVQRSLPWAIPTLAEGFAVARLPARMEVLRRDPPVVIDGAHTPRSVQVVLDTFTQLFGTEGVLLFAAAAGKMITEMAEILAPAFQEIVVTTPGTFRESRIDEVHQAFHRLNPHTLKIPDTAQALNQAQAMAGANRPMLVTGSFYLAGQVRQILYS
jgi:dihydrofolate synthase/folylpolyglutamate synthase